MRVNCAPPQGDLARDQGDLPRDRSATTLVAMLIVSLDQYIVVVALPDIGRELGYSSQTLQSVISAYAVASSGFPLFGGQAVQEAVRSRGIELLAFTIARPEDVAGAINDAKTAGAAAFNVLASPLLYANREDAAGQVESSTRVVRAGSYLSVTSGKSNGSQRFASVIQASRKRVKCSRS